MQHIRQVEVDMFHTLSNLYLEVSTMDKQLKPMYCVENVTQNNIKLWQLVYATGVRVKSTKIAFNETEILKELLKLTGDMTTKINQLSTFEPCAKSLNERCPLVTIHIHRESFRSLQNDPYGDYIFNCQLIFKIILPL
jgi:hypothetical protein